MKLTLSIAMFLLLFTGCGDRKDEAAPNIAKFTILEGASACTQGTNLTGTCLIKFNDDSASSTSSFSMSLRARLPNPGSSVQLVINSPQAKLNDILGISIKFTRNTSDKVMLNISYDNQSKTVNAFANVTADLLPNDLQVMIDYHPEVSPLRIVMWNGGTNYILGNSILDTFNSVNLDAQFNPSNVPPGIYRGVQIMDAELSEVKFAPANIL